MITTLHIKNIGIIEDLSIDFQKGLNVLTGETGAGKTLIMDSLSILSGERFSKEMIRKGENFSYVEACFYEPKSEQAIDGNIIVSREVYPSGRNLCKINGRMVTVAELKQFMSQIIEIHGQNDNQILFHQPSHIKYLDNFIGEEIKTIKDEYNNFYYEYLQIKEELKNNYGDDKERERRLDLLKYQLNEIKQANLKVEEEEELESKRKIFHNSEKLAENLKLADIAIGENTIDSLSTAIRALEKIEDINEKYSEIGNNLKNTYYELQEISRDISEQVEEIDFDEDERNFVEERLDYIYSLKRKYGNNISEILEYKEQICAEIDRIEHLEEYNQKLKKKKNKLKEKMNNIASKIHEIRIKASKELEEQIHSELEDLEMKNAYIHIKIEYKEKEFFKNGKDIVTFYIITNKGEDEKELAKIASGGEISRIMLAIKKVLADTDSVPVLIFDEIDTGISGNAANRVAQKLSAISKSHQVLCISHLPNIAAMSDAHYFISKKVNGDRTNTQIQLLSEEETIKEIARISAGEINEIALKYAYDLRNKKAS